MEYCAKCEREFVSEESLEQHLRHSSYHEYCVRCSKSFNSASALQQHLRDSSKHHICSICTTRMDFDTRDDLEAHLEKVHDHCAPCNRSFDSPQLLEEHDVSAHNLCTICKSYFATAQNLRCHAKTHAAKTVECFGCYRTFRSSSAVLLHLESGNCASEVDNDWMVDLAFECHQARFYTSEDDDYNFECPTCGTPFLAMSGLLQHVESDVCTEGLAMGKPLFKFLRFLQSRLA
ncbi:C2H2 finger domain-containing protein [Metarhizium guizhouense ARSEF 977]|uniref:C2H2 finger domain-containing protein n=1 Tax=Metarhizium guizhouense (strain ARSEF 977) TaxID=1276136 RepID=A0A0B4GTE4_METGA|nr:C2H2 finger domain-containing protein [Metarhizium guizhouense ARSEF 977]